MNNITILEKSKCLGCRSCEQSCPQKCITMQPDKMGFDYPYINTKKCLDCGICNKHCPIISQKIINNTTEKKCYAVILKDNEKLLKSSSGGAFAGIAEYFLKNDGIVYGACYENDLKVKHIRITELKDLNKLQGSKYVESNTDDSFLLVKNDLLAKKQVLFTGCPCQIAALTKYLTKDYPNLYTIDLVCHGTPSQKLFSEYISWLEKKIGEKILYYGFRDKDTGGWSCGGKFITRTRTRTRTRTLIASSDPYYASFLRGDIYRESCYSCPFSNLNRVGDFTVGDLWGANEIVPNMYRKKGISFILLNTEKAISLFNIINQKFYFTECNIKEVAKYNHNLNEPTIKTKNRDIIFENIENNGYAYAFEHIKTKNYFLEFIKESIKDFLRFFLSFFERSNKYGK